MWKMAPRVKRGDPAGAVQWHTLCVPCTWAAALGPQGICVVLGNVRPVLVFAAGGVMGRGGLSKPMS